MTTDKKSIFLLALQLLLSLSANSQNTNYFGWFPTIDHSGKISNRWSYNAYLFDAIKPYNSTVNGRPDKKRSFYVYGETGLTYQINKNLSITAAYVHERQNPFLNDYRTENRLFQQITWKLPIGASELKQRFRFDERFIKNKVSGEAPFTHRLRYLLGINHPLPAERLYLLAYSEVFLNTSKSFKFDENWSALQLGIRVDEKNGIEVGLLYVGWLNSLPDNWLNQYYLQTTWVSHLDFTPKKG